MQTAAPCLCAPASFVVPRGVRHNTSATEDTWIALIETISTLHTGTEQTPLTRSIEEQLAPTS
jgi:hypothetical protein